MHNEIFLPCHSSVKWSDPGDFLKAWFVNFRCKNYVKKGYMEMTKTIYLEPLKSVLGRSTLHYFQQLLTSSKSKIETLEKGVKYVQS